MSTFIFLMKCFLPENLPFQAFFFSVFILLFFFLTISETYGELRCLSGYHLEGGAKEVVCVEGQWSLNGKPQCVSDDGKTSWVFWLL